LWWPTESECRREIDVGQSLFPKFEEAARDVLGEVAFRPGSKFLGGFVEMCTEGWEDPEFVLVGGDLLVDELVGCVCDVNE
jgi:hypothetical protein